MATAEFRAETVVAICAAKIASDAEKLERLHERNILDLMEIQFGGFWPFSKPRLRTRDECEKHYCEDAEIFHTARWWAEQPFKRRAARISAIADLAKAAGVGSVRLDEDEARLVGVA